MPRTSLGSECVFIIFCQVVQTACVEIMAIRIRQNLRTGKPAHHKQRSIPSRCARANDLLVMIIIEKQIFLKFIKQGDGRWWNIRGIYFWK